MEDTGTAQPIIEEPGAVQFQYNSDWPDDPNAQPPSEFPPADPSPCARITTRVYDPHKNAVETVQNVLVRTMLPARQMSSSSNMDDSSSSSSSDDDSQDDVMMQDDTTTSNTQQQEERAYWMQRTVREAIYGRVLYALVLRRRQRNTMAGQDVQADWEVTGEKCAIKEMSWQHIRKERDRLAEDPIKEVSSMQYLQKWYEQQRQQLQQVPTTTDDSFYGPTMATNIMMPLDLLSDDRHLYSIMPYCNGGELFDRLDLNERFSEDEARYWMHQVLNGLENLQRSGICHRDMSLENLLVHENGALIIDMGMCLRIPYGTNSLSDTFESMNLDATTNGNGGGIPSPFFNGRVQPRHLMTPQGTCGKWIYMSPEIYKNEEPFDGFAVDMWASGVILFLMLTGFPPWERACMTDDRFKYMTAGYLVQMLTEWEIGLTSDAMDLLQRMLFIDPKDRLSLDQVKAHPWMVAGQGRVPSTMSRPF